jgi:hypothetical protein
MNRNKLRKTAYPISVAFCTCALVIARPAFAHGCFVENQTVRLSGTLQYKGFYGPPNFGETPREDRLVRVPVLKLATPIRACRGKMVQRVQVQSPKNRNLRSGRRAFFGRIRHSLIGTEFLEYVLELRD